MDTWKDYKTIFRARGYPLHFPLLRYPTQVHSDLSALSVGTYRLPGTQTQIQTETLRDLSIEKPPTDPARHP